MSVDQSLRTLLRALQSPADAEDISRLAQSATALLTLLSNRANVAILTSQLLCAPSIWTRADGLRSTQRVLEIFSDAAREIFRRDTTWPSAYTSSQRLSNEEWVEAALLGTSSSSPRWQSLCLFAGTLSGLQGRHLTGMQSHTRRRLEDHLVELANSVLFDQQNQDPWALNSVVMIIGRVFHVVRPEAQALLCSGPILKQICRATLFSEEGFFSGFFLSNINQDIVQAAGSKFCWLKTSQSFVALSDQFHAPMLGGLGSISLLGATVMDQGIDWMILREALQDITLFAKSMNTQWQQNKLCEVDMTEEKLYLTASTNQETLPLLWKTLSSAMFHTVTLLQAMMRRAINELSPWNPFTALFARGTLQVLRDLAFIVFHNSAAGFAQYRFVFSSATDFLAQHPETAGLFLQELSELRQQSIPQHPLDRYLDLFYLGVAENLAGVLPPEANDRLIIEVANQYLGSGDDPRLSEMFEAAHSAVLAVLSRPQNYALLQKHIHHYLEALFLVFPHALSARQFRVAIKTLAFASSSPHASKISGMVLSSTILEIIIWRLNHPQASDLDACPQISKEDNANLITTAQAVYLLSVIDSLPMISLEDLEIWLPIVMEAFDCIRDASQAELCRDRFWEIMSNGDMDTDRAAFCVSWCAKTNALGDASKVTTEIFG